MIHIISNLFSILGKNFFKNFILFQISIVFSSILEIISIISVGPFVAVVFNKNLIFENEKINYIYLYFNFSNPESFIIFLGIFTFALIFFNVIISILINWRLIIFSQNIGYNLSNRLFSFFLNKNWLFFLKNKKNILISKIQTDVTRLTNEIIRSLFIINSKIILAIFIFSLLLIVSWHLALISFIIFSAFYFLFYTVIRKKILKNSDDISRYSSERIRILNESFYGIKIIILNNIKNYFYNKFNNTSKILSKSLANNLILSQIPKNILELLFLFLIIFIILFLTRFFNNDFSIIFPIIAIYSLSALRLIPALQQIYSSFVSINGSYASYKNIKKDLKDSLYLENSNAKLSFNKKNNLKNLFNNSLYLRNISFRYPGEKKYILKKVNLKIFKNEKIAILGLNGSGKSTLLDLILGLLKPTSGNFYVDNLLLADLAIPYWQKKISYIYQNSILFDGSILNNIIFESENKINVNYEKINQIVIQIGIKNLLKKFTKGIHHKIGDDGSYLSGGQKQKIILARSLYKDSEIIVIDEGTSALDNVSEKIVINHFLNNSKDKTIIIVSHRVDLLKQVDKIILMKNGEIEAVGGYNIIKLNKNFQKLIRN